MEANVGSSDIGPKRCSYSWLIAKAYIVAEEWLTDAVIDAAQVLLKEGFPEMGGLQRTTLGHTLTYAVERGEFVQIVNVRGNHWITVSNIGCQLNHLNVYDSILHGDI